MRVWIGVVAAVLGLAMFTVTVSADLARQDAGGGALDPTVERTEQYHLAQAKVDEAIGDLGSWNADAATFMRWVSAGISKDAAAHDWSNAGAYQAKLNEVRAIVKADVRSSGVVQRTVGDIDAANVLIAHVITGPTTQAQIDHAAALVEEAHEGTGNRIHHPCDGDEAGDPGERCRDSYLDIFTKTQQADELLRYDVMDRRTWDKDQTVRHAFTAALYWSNQTILCECDADGGSLEHTVYQLGILRDILNGLSSSGGSPVGFSGVPHQAAITELHRAADSLHDVGAWVIANPPEEALAVHVLNNIGSAVANLRERGDVPDATDEINTAVADATALQADLAGAPQDVKDDLAHVIAHLAAAARILNQ